MSAADHNAILGSLCFVAAITGAAFLLWRELRCMGEDHWSEDDMGGGA